MVFRQYRIPQLFFTELSKKGTGRQTKNRSIPGKSWFNLANPFTATHVSFDIMTKMLWFEKNKSSKNTQKPSGGFKHVSFSPLKLGKMNPFWRSYFSDGLVKNHQPETHVATKKKVPNSLQIFRTSGHSAHFGGSCAAFGLGNLYLCFRCWSYEETMTTLKHKEQIRGERKHVKITPFRSLACQCLFVFIPDEFSPKLLLYACHVSDSLI